MKPPFTLESLAAVFFDIDGTLVNNNGSILPSTKKAISILKNHNIPCCLASGRATFGAYHLIDELKISDPCMFHSGAAIIDPVSKYPLSTISLKKSEAKTLTNLCKEEGLYLELYTVDAYFSEVDNYLTEIHSRLLKFEPIITKFDTIFETAEFLKGVIVADGEDALNKVYRLKDKLPNLHYGTAPGSHIPTITYTNVTSENASREAAFNWYSNYYSLENRPSIAFGDATSDIPFFRLSRHGIAMKNASDEVKKAAFMVTESNEEDGIWIALQRLFPKEFT